MGLGWVLIRKKFSERQQRLLTISWQVYGVSRLNIHCLMNSDDYNTRWHPVTGWLNTLVMTMVYFSKYQWIENGLLYMPLSVFCEQHIEISTVLWQSFVYTYLDCTLPDKKKSEKEKNITTDLKRNNNIRTIQILSWGTFPSRGTACFQSKNRSASLNKVGDRPTIFSICEIPHI